MPYQTWDLRGYEPQAQIEGATLAYLLVDVPPDDWGDDPMMQALRRPWLWVGVTNA